jgi:hypothetical protein
LALEAARANELARQRQLATAAPAALTTGALPAAVLTQLRGGPHVVRTDGKILGVRLGDQLYLFTKSEDDGSGSGTLFSAVQTVVSRASARAKTEAGELVEAAGAGNGLVVELTAGPRVAAPDDGERPGRVVSVVARLASGGSGASASVVAVGDLAWALKD